MFNKVLIANRGEIALRIMRSCRELGIPTVVIHSTADADAMHVRLADESVCVGPPPSSESYLNISAILAAADITGADAIHPGYGFLSENADFAQAVEDHDMVFIGPRPSDISTMGDKIAAKRQAEKLGLPMVRGAEVHGLSSAAALAAAGKVGFPLIIKAASGGGGRGMQRVFNESDFIEKLEICSSEAKAAFGDDTVYIEELLLEPRHIEVQVLGDGKGKVLHFWERDCSLQRRHQKVVEEAPASILTHEQRLDICQRTADALSKMKYRGAGTVEYLYKDGHFAFIEMNTRIQVEHPITEMITGEDLIFHQLSVAAGKPLTLLQQDIHLDGHSIEFRINAEDPRTGIPKPGTVTGFHAAGGLGTRTDSHMFTGYKLPAYYDSMIGKLIVHAPDRNAAINRMRRALQETVVEGVLTNIPALTALLVKRDFVDGNFSIDWFEKQTLL